MVAKGKAKAVAEPGFWNIANQVTLFRVFMVFAALYLASLQGAFLLNLFGVALIPLAFALDAVDGFIARKFGAATRFGSFFDVFGDRVTELTLWIFFLSTNAVPFWAVLVVVLRGLATDAVRAEALSKGKTVYGMMESGAGKAFVSSRFMRGFYGAAKAVLFTLLAFAHAFQAPLLAQPIGYLVFLVVALNLLRGYPVLAEGSRFFH